MFAVTLAGACWCWSFYINQHSRTTSQGKTWLHKIQLSRSCTNVARLCFLLKEDPANSKLTMTSRSVVVQWVSCGRITRASSSSARCCRTVILLAVRPRLLISRPGLIIGVKGCHSVLLNFVSAFKWEIRLQAYLRSGPRGGIGLLDHLPDKVILNRIIWNVFVVDGYAHYKTNSELNCKIMQLKKNLVTTRSKARDYKASSKK